MIAPGLHNNFPPAVVMENITRRFGRIIANNNISLTVRRAEVHALVGENGAGKSTLMKILYGLYRPDSGTIRINGNPRVFHSPRQAIAAGVGMVHQHFMLVATFTVAENIILGHENARWGFIRRADSIRRVTSLTERYRMDIDPRALTGDLSVGLQQRVEILKILCRNASIIILDEPTAVLTPQEVSSFFTIVRELQSAGKTVILITHKLREVMAISDSLTVLRGGRKIADLRTADTTAEEIARLMVGHDVILPALARETGADMAPSQAPELPHPEDAEITKTASPHHDGAENDPQPALSLKDIHLHARDGRILLDGVSLKVNPGEILGIAGVEGNGQTELVEVITGLRIPRRGRITICGRDVTHLQPRGKFQTGLSCIPEDRQRYGLALNFTLRDNLRLGRHHKHKSGQGRNDDFTMRGARGLLKHFGVRPPDPRLRADQLSGGNQQKVVAAREFSRMAPVMVAAQPTRGLDLGATEFLHRQLLELRSRGAAILLISAELSEILALSDFVAVMCRGSIVFHAANANLSEMDLGIWMGGG